MILRYSRNRHSSSKLLFGFQIFVVIHQFPLLRFFFFSAFRFPGALLSLSSLLSFLITTWCPNLPYHHPPVIFHTFCISPFTLFSRVAFPSFFLLPYTLFFSIFHNPSFTPHPLRSSNLRMRLQCHGVNGYEERGRSERVSAL